MSKRVVIIPGNSLIAEDSKTKILHKYPNGELLVETEALISEFDSTVEIPVLQGVTREKDLDKNLNSDRDSMENLNPEDIILAYVEFIGPIDPLWVKKVKDLGISLLRYQPEHSYFSRGVVKNFKEVKNQEYVFRVTPYVELLKPTNEKLGESNQNVWIVVQASRDEVDAIINELEALPNVEIDSEKKYEAIDFYVRIPAVVNLEGQDQLVKHSRVISVENREEPKIEDEVAGLIVAGSYDIFNRPTGSYLQLLDQYGVSGEGVTIGIVDDGIDDSHEAFENRIIDLSAGNKNWHGTFVAGHAAGSYIVETDENNFIYGLGVAPDANLLSQDKQGTTTDLCKETVTETGVNGEFGLIQNNSWGAGISNPMDYLSSEATYDSLVRNSNPDGFEPKPLTICFSSGNNGSKGLTRPKAAKNILVTGNSENYRPKDPGSSDSDDINEVYTGHNPSSHGNCGDGRIRPHVVAPGEWTSSAGYDISDGEQVYISPKLTWGGGSSGASPKTAGVCALLIQWWRQHTNGLNPSPAMLRALIVNGAEPINFKEFIPNKYEGWGRVNFQNILYQEVHHTYVDQTLLLQNRGEQFDWDICVTDSQKPLKITLAWTDPPGPIGSGKSKNSSPIVNKLALRVEVNGKVYRGNNFINGWSTDEEVVGAQIEGTDNLQNIYLNEGLSSGVIRVTVYAMEITTNCLNGQIDTPQQDFALVITNGHIDQGYTPTDVFLLVDESINGDLSPVDYPEEESSNNGLSSDSSAAFSSSSNDFNTIEKNWWEDTGEIIPEGKKPLKKVESTKDDALAESVRSGIEVGRVRKGNRILFSTQEPNSNERLDSIDSESSQESISLETVKQSSLDLSTALGSLMKNWTSYGGGKIGTSVIQNRSAVLVINSGTRISEENIAIMKKLTFMGNLFVVSDQGNTLAFLAQHIHRQLGIQFRLSSTVDLDYLIQQTIIEASGAQELDVKTSYQNQINEFFSLNTFNIVNEDMQVVVRILYSVDEELPQVKILRPDVSPIQWTSALEVDNVETFHRDGVLQFTFNSSEVLHGWEGKWEIQITKSNSFSPQETVSAWVWSKMNLNVKAQETKSSEANLGKEETLVKVSSHIGSKFSHCQIEPKIINRQTSLVESETERIISKTIRPSRLDYEANLERNQKESTKRENEKAISASASSIGAWVRHPLDSEGSTIVDLSIKVTGSNKVGKKFERIIRNNLIKLIPSTNHDKKLKGSEVLDIIGAVISEISYDSSGNIKSIRMQKNRKIKDVYISNSKVAEHLKYINLFENSLVFRVKENTLLAVIKKVN